MVDEVCSPPYEPCSPSYVPCSPSYVPWSPSYVPYSPISPKFPLEPPCPTDEFGSPSYVPCSPIWPECSLEPLCSNYKFLLASPSPKQVYSPAALKYSTKLLTSAGSSHELTKSREYQTRRPSPSYTNNSLVRNHIYGLLKMSVCILRFQRIIHLNHNYVMHVHQTTSQLLITPKLFGTHCGWSLPYYDNGGTWNQKGLLHHTVQQFHTMMDPPEATRTCLPLLIHHLTCCPLLEKIMFGALILFNSRNELYI
jgi:hypothetical protein